LSSLKSVPVPRPPTLSRYVRDNAALVALGKALFWDVQVSSDGRVACATCHFHAGADHRVQNQFGSPPGIAAAIAPNLILSLDMFPFRKLSDPTDNRSAVVSDLRVVAGSAGQFHRRFAGLAPGSAVENGIEITGEPNLTLAGLSTRQVTGRNSPSVIKPSSTSATSGTAAPTRSSPARLPGAIPTLARTCSWRRKVRPTSNACAWKTRVSPRNR
jgi:hypothetical protein